MSLGQAYWHLGDRLNELQVYEKALMIHPDYVDLWFNKGTCLIHEERFIEAKECLEKVRILDPTERYALGYIDECEKRIEHIAIDGVIDRDPTGHVKDTVYFWKILEDAQELVEKEMNENE